jgi:uncharacterized protein YggE
MIKMRADAMNKTYFDGQRLRPYLLFLMAASLAGPVHGASAEATPHIPTIEVTAETQVEATPDLATLDFGVVTQADTAAAAGRENAERMDAVLATVRKAAGAGAQIRTGSYVLRPNYASPREGGAPRVTGYTATNVVQLRTAELARIGDIIDAAVRAGANQVQRIAFSLKDPSASRAQALRAAVQKARGEADALAAALGVKLKQVHSLVEQDTGGVRPLVREAAVAFSQAAPATPVEPGVVEVRARIVLRMAIE